MIKVEWFYRLDHGKVTTTRGQKQEDPDPLARIEAVTPSCPRRESERGP